MEKGADAFRSIGEVAKMIGVAPHVLRYWETQFSLLNPMKRRDGRRYYRPDDVRLVAGLCEVLREEGLTIRGARKLLASDRGAAIRLRGAARLGEAILAPTNDVDTAPPVARSAPVQRQRKRAHEPVGKEKPLPLFPEMPPPPADPTQPWLHQLVTTAATLRLRHPQSAIPDHAREAALSLHKALGTRN